jgi:hypothetical protein
MLALLLDAASQGICFRMHIEHIILPSKILYICKANFYLSSIILDSGTRGLVGFFVQTLIQATTCFLCPNIH